LTLTLAACGGGGATFSSGGNPPPPPSKEFIFGDGNNSVLAFSVNTQTGAPTQTSTIPGNQGGFGIVANPAVTFLYADDVTNGGIDAFSVSSSGVLSSISGSPFPMPSDWAPPQVDNIAIDPAGKFLYTPDAASNAIVGFTINGSTGALAPMSGSPFPAGASPQQVVISPSGNFLYASDGNDPQGGISAYTIDSSTGALTSIAGSPFPTAVGGGPDGLVVDSTGKFLFAALPFLNGVAAFTIDSSTGVLTSVAGSPFLPSLGGAFPIMYSIALSPNGKFLYAQGDMNAEIYGFTIDPSTGALTSMAGSPFGTIFSTFMNNLVVDPSGSFLYVGETGGDSFSYLTIDPTTGALRQTANVFFGFSRSLAVVKIP
jgi:6-phosphogluconolactonase (cycloisomerase 2 family)